MQAADLDLPDAAEYAINIGFDDFRTFLKDFSANLALEGMFVEAAEPQPPGAEVAFELSLRDGHPLVQGRGVVAWSRAASGKAEASAIGIRFLDLEPRSERLVRRIVEERTKAGLGLFDLDQEPLAGRDRVSGDAVPGTQAAAGGASEVGEIESLRVEIEKLKCEQAEERRRRQAELDAVREAKGDLNSRLSDSLSRVVTISESRQALAGQLRSSEESHRRDGHRLEALEEERSELEQAVEEQKSEVARWTEEAVAANTGLEALESQKSSLEEEIEAGRGKAAKFASEVEDAQATLAVEKTAKESLERELHEAKAALEKLEAEADATETALCESLEHTRADLEESSAKAGELEKEVESLRSELGEVQGKSEAFQAEIASIRTELEPLKSRHDEMKTQAAAQQEAAARAEKLVERVRAEHASLQDDLLEAQTALGEVADLERPLTTDELEEVRPEVFTPLPPEAHSDELPEAENAPAPSKLRVRLARMARRLLGGRGAGETSDQFLHVPSFEDAVSGSEADDVELTVSEAAHADRRLSQQAAQAEQV